jgi:hypothetical protein
MAPPLSATPSVYAQSGPGEKIRTIVAVQNPAIAVYTVPRRVEHAPRAASGTRILMVEPRGTVNTGNPETDTTGTRLV